MKMKILKGLALVMAMVCLFCFPVPASAASQGTDGTEMEVVQPQKLEIQLGEAWAGVEFELKTDAGMYPGTIPVGDDGVLRLEIGGSENYILTCMNSAKQAPAPDETIAPEETVDPADGTQETDPTETVSTTDPSETVPAEEVPENTIAGIPVKHLALFGGGMVLAIGALVGISVYQKKGGNRESEEDDDDL